MNQSMQQLICKYSKTFVEGSNPSAPAKSKSLEAVEFQGSSHVFGKMAN